MSGEGDGLGLPAFDPDAPCPKCGHDQISTDYHGATCDRWPGTCPVHMELSRPACCTAEHLHRWCDRCKFRWAEAVIPSPAGSPGVTAGHDRDNPT